MNTPDEQRPTSDTTVKRRRGRPPGSKNKALVTPELKQKEAPAPSVADPVKTRRTSAEAPSAQQQAKLEPARQKKREYQHHSGKRNQRDRRYNASNDNNEEGTYTKPNRPKVQRENNRPNKHFNRNNKNQGRNANNHHQKREQQGDEPRSNSRESHQQTQRDYIPVGEPEEITGLVEITPKNFGFLLSCNGEMDEEKIYIPADLIAQHHLRPYVQVTGMAQRFERGHQLISISAVNGFSPEDASIFPHFDELKAVNPSHRIAFETEPQRYTTRTLDLVAPIARGQRGLIVAPPRTGKTTLLMHMAEAIEENYSEDIHLMVLLVDERPEEVTEFKRCLPHAEIYASSNDCKVFEHCRKAEICIERAKRLVESGRHVLLLLDSITRLARAYNNNQRGNGRTMSGGIDARALEIPRRLFAAARDTRTAGSLSIIATALIETNSRMDDLIFQEFKGTGNMELVLNRRIAEMYIYPAVDILKSGTRREELILPSMQLEKIRLIRRALAGHKPVEAMERLLFFLRKYKSNAQMLIDLKSR